MRYLTVIASVTFLFIGSPVHADDYWQSNYAKQHGIKRCASAVSEISKLALEKSDNKSDASRNGDDPDGRLLSFFVDRATENGSSHVNMQFFPYASGCDAVFTETSVIEKPCAVVREEMFKGLQYKASLRDKTATFYNEKDGTSVYLSSEGQSGNLCLVTVRGIR